MKKQRIHYRRTTASQRKFLFEVWEATRDVDEACGQARVSRRTFYYWKPRFDADGYKGLEQVQKPGTKTPNRTSVEIEEQVLGLRQAHPSWGKRRLADELAKANNWERVISPNTVRRILKDAGLWTASQKRVKKGGLHP